MDQSMNVDMSNRLSMLLLFDYHNPKIRPIWLKDRGRYRDNFFVIFATFDNNNVVR